MKDSSKIPWRGLILFVAFIASCALVIWLGEAKKKYSISHKTPRVVSLTPNVTEILYEMGAQDSLVGISDYCHLPDSRPLPKCGGLLDPNYERILKVNPSIIFLLGRMDRIAKFATDHGIKPVSTHIDSFSDLIREIGAMGDLLNKKDAAKDLVQKLESRRDSIQKNSSRLPNYRCLILMSESGSLKGMTAIGGPSFISEMLNVAGGENVFASQKMGYFIASRETVLALQPEIIFEIRGRSLSSSEKEKISDRWSSYGNLIAVQKKQIVILDGDFYTIPGPRMLDIAEQFQKYFEIQTQIKTVQ